MRAYINLVGNISYIVSLLRDHVTMSDDEFVTSLKIYQSISQLFAGGETVRVTVGNDINSGNSLIGFGLADHMDHIIQARDVPTFTAHYGQGIFFHLFRI